MGAQEHIYSVTQLKTLDLEHKPFALKALLVLAIARAVTDELASQCPGESQHIGGFRLSVIHLSLS